MSNGTIIPPLTITPEPGVEKPWYASSDSEEWYTPTYIIDAAREVLGEIDLDPASSMVANTVVKATSFYSREQDGLSQPWAGRVWMNPPFGRIIGKFTDKLLAEYKAGNVKTAIMLCPANPETRWFQPFLECGVVCYPKGRINFWTPGKAGGGGSTFSPSLIYLGPNPRKFTTVFEQFGRVSMPMGMKHPDIVESPEIPHWKTPMNEHTGVSLDFGPSLWKRDEPEPETSDVELLDDLVDYYRKYVRVGEDEYTVLAAWVLHCHAFKAFSRTPYLSVKSPTPECGKTQLLEVTKLVCPQDAQMACSMTAAVLARFTDRYHAPLLLDEVDKLRAGDKDLYSAVMGIVNGGYKASGNRMLLVPVKGGDWGLRNLSTFSPKMLAGISGLEPATASRCIPINMERLLPSDAVQDLDEYLTEPEARAIQERAARWAAQNLGRLKRMRPDSPAQLKTRHREVSRALFAVADLASPEWGKKIREAVVRLFAAQAAEPADDIKVELLEDIRQAFDEKDRIASADLVSALVSMEERPWGTWGKSRKPMTQHQLAHQLKDFKVYAKSVRLDDGRNLKGYLREWLEPIWARYLPHTDTQVVTSSQPAQTLSETQFSGRHKESDVTSQKCEKPAPILHCDDVTTQKPEVRGVQEKAGEKPNGKPASEVRCPNCGTRDFYRGHGRCLACGTEPDFTHIYGTA